MPREALILKDAGTIMARICEELKDIKDELRKIRKALNRLEGW